MNTSVTRPNTGQANNTRSEAPMPAALQNNAGSGETPTPRTLTKIVATIGPASESPDAVRRLILAGVSVFRFNFSHGDFAAHSKRLAVVRAVSQELNRSIAVLGDLQGPKIRVGKIPEGVGTASRSGGGTIEALCGQDVVFKRGIKEAFYREVVNAPAGTREPVLPVTYEALINEVKQGQRVLINDGAIRMLAVESNNELGELRCRVIVGGPITSGKGINLPQSDISAPAITDRDWECVDYAVANDFDYLALSFVRRAEEVLLLRNKMIAMYAAKGDRSVGGSWIPIVSKIEKPQALTNLEAIVEASDAIMVARGDLGVEMDIAQVPVAQKRIVAAAAKQGKPCIVATQMLETMIDNTSPTRAEASDVANAVFDGADAVMLSAETATGKHPALVVETMSRIVFVAEQRFAEINTASTPPTTYSPEHRQTAALAHGAWHICRDLKSPLIACWSEGGGTARYLSQNNFSVPILCFTTDARIARRMALFCGVIPVCSPPPKDRALHGWNSMVVEMAKTLSLVRDNDWIVMLAGRPLGKARATNAIAVHQVGKPVPLYDDKD